MKIARFEPLSYVDLLQRKNDNVLSRYETAAWSPAVDILEEESRFLLRADLPGVDSSDIDVSMDAGELTVSGTRSADDLGEGYELRRAERSSGQFFRRFTLPETADADNISAKSSNGILEVSIPKVPEIKARRISVEAA